VPESSPQHLEKAGKGTFLKAVGAIAAVVSLLLALNQLTGVVQGLRIHHKQFSEAMKSGEQEQLRGDYPAAFRSFKHAVELDPVDRGAQAKEAQAAMLWLENAHGSETQTFTDVANELLPVLDNALSKAKGQVAGDLLAHIAWANFLKYRNGVREGVDVDGSLKAAFAADANNVYAHTISGFWIMWQGGDFRTAKEHFSTALATGRVRAYVRDLELSALENSGAVENDVEEIRIANEMRKAGEPLSRDHRHRIFWNDFTSHLHDRDSLVAVLKAIPAADAEATYDWLDDRKDGEEKAWSHAFVMANLKEVTGYQAEALFAYRTLQKQMQNSKNSALLPVVDMSIKRLTHSH
jgi:tetratricopeptide (TPR) repeat protein